ncbi:MAG: AAA family ATPase [Candidatus Pacebacteria bacterium]|nr:AAA family ATPase [Candidatus Paceibacterota bacterium]
MKIKSVLIKNFRGIEKLDSPIELLDLNVFIGDNATCKTTILEAINFCLSPSFSASRLCINDFYQGSDREIEIIVEFAENFIAKLPDGYTTQDVECNKVALIAKKRDRSAPQKAFSDLVSMSHYVIPVAQRGEEGWSQPRKSSPNDFKFTERQLSFPVPDVELPRCFYFPKTRSRQLSKGYNSSLSNIIDDLNWRFDKSQRTKTEDQHFKHDRKNLHEKVISETGGDTIKKTIDESNKILKELGIDEINLSLFKTLTPYDGAELLFPFDGFELPIGQSGSGVEMAVSLVFLETLAKISKEKILIVIDEPELHLHPTLQDKIINHLKSISDEIQIVVSTHSPFLFKNVYHDQAVNLLLTKKESGKFIIEDARSSEFGLLKWSPSWGEICYFAYDLPTPEFHDDLYSSLQDQNGTETIASAEAWLIANGQNKEIKWTDDKGNQVEETIMTYIRNRIHHNDNQNRPAYTVEQLRDSIQRMIDLLRPAKT